MEVAGYFETLASAEFAVDVAVIFATFLGAHIVAPTVNGYLPVDVPNEVHGLVIVVLAEALGGDYKRPLQLGGGLYTADEAAGRVELQSRIEGAM